MSTSVRVSYDEYEERIERGEFDDDPRRFELIDGEILPMVAPNPPHDFVLDQMTYWSIDHLPRGEARVRNQSGLGIPALESLPIPDLAWVRFHDYRRRHPQPEEVLLIVEVAFSSLSLDRKKKGPVYARAGIADYWIVNLRGECVEIYRDPGPNGYRSRTFAYPGEEIRPLASPDLAFSVSLVFPEEEAEAAEEGGPRP